MSDRRPERVYGILVREGKAFLCASAAGLALPGGEFRPLAEDRKVELKAHLAAQLGITARAVWAQGAFEYRQPGDITERFSGFYTVWEWDGEVPEGAGAWVDREQVQWAPGLSPSIRILLLSILDTVAMKTR